MFKRLFAAAVVLTAVSAIPAHAKLLSMATFSADRDSRTVFSFYDRKFPFSAECSTEGKSLVQLSVKSANWGTIISEGCWERMENGDARIHLSDRYPVHGVMTVKKAAIERF